MEFGAAELKLIDNQEPIRFNQQDDDESQNSNSSHPLDNKHKEEGAPSRKKIKLEDHDEDGNLECLKNLCELVAENGEALSESKPVSDNKPNLNKTESDPDSPKKKMKKKKKKKKLVGVPEDDSETPKNASNNKKQNTSNKKSNMRKNIRDILKVDELEAETRAAQQREMERVQRLQQQQQRQQQLDECTFIPSFEVDEDDSNDPTSTLVEDLHALAQELEDSSTLSPEIPLDFLHSSNQELKAISPSSSSQSTNISASQEASQTGVKSQANDFDDVICLSSDEEAAPSKPALPFISNRISKPYVPCDDDDDVVILSGDDEASGGADEEEGDVHNFGLHTRDHLNQPDSEGRVLVNVGHPSNENDIFLPPQLARAAKPHQIGGIRFLYDNVVESLEQYSISNGFGCILAHSMGLGKTFQVCTFSEVFLRNTQAKTVLIIVPINTIQNWLAEFNHWLPAERGPEETPLDPSIQPRSFTLHVLNDTTKDFNSRLRVISDWSNQGGVLLIGYEMYRLFYSQRESKVKKNGPRKKKGLVDLEEEEKEKLGLERIYQALVNPGPELVICDEGHRIKNMKTGIAVALKEIRTRRRVVLTGYPLQNNLLEYWCMVDFVRPNFLGTRTEFGNMFERPIQNGQCVDSSPADVKLMKERVYVLHSLVKGFVQRRSHAVLRNSLPRKEEHVLMLRLSPLQRALYRNAMSELVQNKSVCNPLKAFAICLKIWNHPDVLYNYVKKSQDDVDLDLLDDDTTDSSVRKKKKTKKNNTSSSLAPATLPTPLLPSLHNPASISGYPNPTVDEIRNGVDPSLPIPGTHPPSEQGAPSAKEKKEEFFTSMDWANELLKGYVPGDIENAAKTQLFFTILEEAVGMSDRLLLFSQSLFTLNLLEEFLQQRAIPGRQDEKWAKNRTYFRLDGSTNGMEREKLVNEFNSNPDVMLFLISTRAGSLGINLIGANRVIVFDASWNPCHDAQAVCRVYRYGQKKPCYIYRFVTDNSLEKKIYDRQIGKQGTADRVVDELNPEARLSLKDVTTLVCDDEDDPPPKDYGESKHSRDLSLTDPVLEKVMERWGSSFTKDPFQHDTLLAESKESKLSTAEKRMAQRLYEKAKMDGSMQYRRQSYSNYYPKMPVSLPTMDNGHGSYGEGAYARAHQSNFPPIRPTGIPGRSMINNPSQSSGMDILAEALVQGKLVCKEMVLTKDVTIARNQMGSGSESSPIVLPTGTRVKLIKTPKGIYMQTPEGKIFRIHSSTPTTPTSPSSIAAALGIGNGNSSSGALGAGKPPFLPGFAQPGSKSPMASSSSSGSVVDNSMLKRLRELHQKPIGANGNRQTLSFNDKSALLAQIRQNLAAGKGLSNSAKLLLERGQQSSASPSFAGKFGLPVPGSNSQSPNNLNHFAKQLAALAQKSAADSLADLIHGGIVSGGRSSSNSEIDSGSNSGSSPSRPSSLLDPKARALPSASLPKKVATIAPNVSKARYFTPNRPTAAVEPLMSKVAPVTESIGSIIPSVTSDSSMLSMSSGSTQSALSALSALSASPMVATAASTTPAASLTRAIEMPPTELLDYGNDKVEQDGPAKNGAGSGLFDNLSLASQLEGFASSTVKSAAPAESLKDLLRTTSSNASQDPPPDPAHPVSQFQWSRDTPTTTNPPSYPSWPEYNPWVSNGWNGGGTQQTTTSWSGSNMPWSSSEQQQQQPPITSNYGSTGVEDTNASAPPGTTEMYNNHQQYGSNFGMNHPWPSTSTSFDTSNPAAGSTSVTGPVYPSHSPADQFQGAGPYFPATSYFNNSTNSSTFSTYPQSSQLGFPGAMNNFHLNHPYGGNNGNTFNPGYSQPYPGSFSQ